MQLWGPLATLLVDLAPEIYGPYLTKDKQGHPVLYMCILNAMYGIMRAALLYYQHFVADIHGISFKLNPYDPCVANKLVDGNQLTLIWHIDNIRHCIAASKSSPTSLSGSMKHMNVFLKMDQEL